MDEREQLLHLFRIEPSDLDANRAGRLSERERRRYIRQWVTIVVVGALISALFTVEAVSTVRSSQGTSAQWIVPALLALVAGALTVVAGVGFKRSIAKPVTCISGPVSIEITNAGRGGRIVRLKASGKLLTLPAPPGGLGGVVKAYRAVLTDQPYHVYVLGPRVVAMEPATEMTPHSIGGSPDAQPVTVRGDHPLRLNAFGITCLALGVVFAVVLCAAGGWLTVVQLTGTQTTATVTDCVQDIDSRSGSYDCNGTWVAGGDLVFGNGHVEVGTVQGAEPSDIGKNLEVRLSGDEAYTESLLLPIIIGGLGLVMMALTVFALIRAVRRPSSSPPPRAS
jgi:hypothetical protein